MSNNTFEDVIQAIKKGERIGSFLFNNLKVDLQISFFKDLSARIQELVYNIAPEIVSTPPMLLLKYFTSFDIDLKFNSSEEFPEIIRN